MKPAFLLEAIPQPLQAQQYLVRRIEGEDYEQVWLSGWRERLVRSLI